MVETVLAFKPCVKMFVRGGRLAFDAQFASKVGIWSALERSNALFGAGL
jgi:hypothetical protein